MNLSDYVLRQLQAHKGDLLRVAREAGVSRRTIGYLLKGKRDARISTMEALAKHFRDRERGAA